MYPSISIPLVKSSFLINSYNFAMISATTFTIRTKTYTSIIYLVTISIYEDTNRVLDIQSIVSEKYY
jgi:hypothetical protein